MSEEEKKAIVRAREYLTNPAGNYLSDEKIEILLDLIDKQEERLVKFQEHIDNQQKVIKEQQNEIDKQQKEIEELKEITKEYDSYIGEKMPLDSKIIIADREYFINGTFVNNFISKDKIRDKIKTLEEKIHIVIPNQYNQIEVINEFKNEGALNILEELLLEE